MKGPDFVSRLRGYVNIMGPNPPSDDVFACIVRRAMLLRSLIERTRVSTARSEPASTRACCGR